MSDESICLLCEKVIEGSVLTVETGETFHPECFFCDKCNGPLTSPFSKNADGKKLCNKCKTVVKCSACGEGLKELGQRWGTKTTIRAASYVLNARSLWARALFRWATSFPVCHVWRKKGLRLRLVLHHKEF